MKVALVLVALVATLGGIAVWKLSPSSPADAGVGPLSASSTLSTLEDLVAQPADALPSVQQATRAPGDVSSPVPVESSAESRVSAGAEVADLQLDPASTEETGIRGRLVDKDGQSLAQINANLKVRRGETDHQSLWSKTDDEGSFIAPLKQAGEVTFAATVKGIGRSLDVTVVVPEGQAADVGDVQLLGDGIIRGHVRLPTGDPFPDLLVRCSAVDEWAAPGLTYSSTKTAEDGSFELTALAPGTFRFTFWKMDELRPTGSDELQVDNKNAEFVLDAVLLTITSVNEQGEEVMMMSIEHSAVLTETTAADVDASASGYSLVKGFESYDLAVIPRRSYMIQAVGKDGTDYFAYLQGTLPAGAHKLQLVPSPMNLASVRLSVPAGSIPTGASLTLTQIKRNGRHVSRSSLIGEDKETADVFELKGLVPGSYEGTAFLKNGGWRAIVAPQRTFDLTAGEVEQIDLDTWEGGRISLGIRPSPGGSSENRGDVWFRSNSDSEWSPPMLISKRENSTSHGGQVWLDGTKALSRVLKPGTYQVKVTGKEGRSVQAEAVVQAGATTSLELILQDQ